MWIQIFGAIVAVIVGEIGAKAITGKGLVERMTGQDPFGWWCQLREGVILPWVRENAHLGIGRVVAVLTCRVDRLAVAGKKLVSALVFAETDHGPIRIGDTEYEIPADVIGVHEAGDEIELMATV
jgi:hypothetical protein